MQEVQQHGHKLQAWLKSLAGIKNNNPRNAPGVAYTKWQQGFVPTNRAGKAVHDKGESTCKLLQQLSFVGTLSSAVLLLLQQISVSFQLPWHCLL